MYYNTFFLLPQAIFIEVIVMQVIEYRRALHRIPELDRDLPETLAYLRSVVEPLVCSLFSPIPGAL